MSDPNSTRPKSLRQIFGFPLLLALISGAGLIAALLEDGWPDLVAGAFVAVPVAVIVLYLWFSLRNPQRGGAGNGDLD